MRQKYVLVKNDTDQELVIKEYAELDKEIMSLLCEEAYPLKRINTAVDSGKESLIQALRTNNMYPPSIYSDKIAESVIFLLADKRQTVLELFFDDSELLNRERQSAEGRGDRSGNDTIQPE